MAIEWRKTGSFQGPPGEPASIEIESVETGDPGTDVEVHDSSTTPGVAKFNFKIPHGATGPSVEIEIGDVEAAEQDADPEVTVENIPEEGRSRLSFKLPRGFKGQRGTKGNPGEPGEKGDQGDRGNTGRTATVRFQEEVTVLPPGTEIGMAINRGTVNDAILELALPQGEKGDSGRGYNFRGPWAPFTNYEVDDTVAYDGSTYRRLISAISTATFTAEALGRWEIVARKGDKGSTGDKGDKGDGYTYRGAWTAATAYAINQTVTRGGQTYAVLTPHTSGTTFEVDSDKWVLFAAKGDKGETLTTTPQPTLASVLNIGPNPGQNHFFLQYAETPRADGAQVLQRDVSYDQIVGGAVVPEVRPTPDGKAVRFYVRVDGPTSGGSIYPRAELREQNLTGSSMAFDPKVGTHWMSGRTKIVNLPVTGPPRWLPAFDAAGLAAYEQVYNPSLNKMEDRINADGSKTRKYEWYPGENHGGVKPEAVFFQVHNNNNDVLSIRTQISTDPANNNRRTLKLVVRVNGEVGGNADLGAPRLGQEFDWAVRLVEGYAYIYFKETGAVGNLYDKPVFSSQAPNWTITDSPNTTYNPKGTTSLGYGVYLDTTTTPPTYRDLPGESGSKFNGALPAWYFKAGIYTQTNKDIEASGIVNRGGASGTPAIRFGSTDPTDLVYGDPQGYFEIELSRLQHWHTGWPAPQIIDYGMYVAGPPGSAGSAATVRVGDVSSKPWSPTVKPEVKNTYGDASNALLDFTIPEGRPATVTVNPNVGRLENVENPYVTVTGSGTSDVDLKFSIPEGKKGATGEIVAIRVVTVDSQGANPADATIATDIGHTTTAARYVLGVPRGPAGQVIGVRALPAALAPGSSPTVEFDAGSTATQARLVFGLPEGQKGATGDKGEVVAVRATPLGENDLPTAGFDAGSTPTQSRIVLGIPQGKTGGPGPAPVVLSPVVTSVAPINTTTLGTATVVATQDPTTRAVTFTFGIPQGLKGDTGISGIKPRGSWNPGIQYAARDMVAWGGSSYYALETPLPQIDVPPTGTAANAGTNDTAVNTGWALLALEGAQGPKGDRATMRLATGLNGEPPAVTTLASDQSASVSLTGPSTDGILAFGIPRGIQGAQGFRGTIRLRLPGEGGAITTGAAGTDASVTLAGTAEDGVLSFVIPRGDKGDRGTMRLRTAEEGGAIATGAAGTDASVTLGGTSTDGVLSFVVPRGDKGLTGDAATLAFNPVQTGLPGTNAVLTNDGDTHNAVMNLTVPRGDVGQTGQRGTKWWFGHGAWTAAQTPGYLAGDIYVDLDTAGLPFYALS